MKTKYGTILHGSEREMTAQEQLVSLLKKSPIPDDELLANLGLYLTSKEFSRLLFFYEIYRKIVNVHGMIMEFGTRWGQTAAILAELRAIFEPYNRIRKIVAFDTFSGHLGMSQKDGRDQSSAEGEYSVTKNYEIYLEDVLKLKEELNPLSHLRKFKLAKGDVAKTLPAYLERHPESIISLAVFDIDLYTPTKAVLEVIQSHLCKGSILVFDELCDEVFPGVTVALREVSGGNMRHLQIRRLPMTSRLSYIEVE